MADGDAGDPLVEGSLRDEDSRPRKQASHPWSVCSPIAPSACVLLGATESYALEVPCEESIACIY